MKILATICSKYKDENPSDIPARKRYIGDNIKTLEKIAKESNLPFFILSGKFGLISGDKEIPNYDYYLEGSQVNAITELIEKQIIETGITEIDFYAEDKESWAPYVKAMEKGAKLAGILITIHKL